MKSRLLWRLACGAAVATLHIVSLPAISTAAEMVAVPLDVDVYDHPGGEGKPRKKNLRANSTVNLLVKRKDHWCQVEGDAVPGGKGWVWCGKGGDQKNYALMPVGTGGSTSTGEVPPAKSGGPIPISQIPGATGEVLPAGSSGGGRPGTP